jgi:formylglycine-generating enzyme required for sulfatase activity
MNSMGRRAVLAVACWFGTVIAEEPADSVHAGMRLIPGGTFFLGSMQLYGREEEYPMRRTVVDTFWIDTTEVTQESYVKVMGANPSYFTKCRKTGRRLPAETEWEYAAKFHNNWPYYWGHEKDSAGLYAWFIGNSADATHPVASKRRNGFGLYDMSGNVWEWCSDQYRPYDSESTTESGKEFKVIRGGSWSDFADAIRTTARDRFNPYRRRSSIGFRCAGDHRQNEK